MYQNNIQIKDGKDTEEGLRLPVYPSDLKMVKVKKGKRGGQKGSSLVFRISRRNQAVTDDSGIKCSSASEDEISDVQNQHQEPVRSPLKIRIPKSLLLNPLNNESGFSECDTSLDWTFQNMNENSDILNTNTEVKNDKNNPVQAEDPTSTISKPAESKSYDLRRSSRQVVLRLQKESKQSVAPETVPSVDCNVPFVNSINEGHTGFSQETSSGVKCNVPFVSSSNEGCTIPAIPVKRRRGKKPGPCSKNADGKIRRYGRRGRPPKEPLRDLNIVKPIIVGNIRNENEIVLQPVKSSVWTLVPKELFESEFFKSQVIKVRSPNPLNRKRFNPPLSFSSFSTPRPIIPQTNGQMRFRFPKIVSPRPVIQQKAPENKECKRPTVIYFKNERKNVNECPPDHQASTNEKSQINDETTQNQTGLSYLLNKYCTLEDIVIKTIYELTSYDVYKTDSILSDLHKNSCVFSPEETNDLAELLLDDAPHLSTGPPSPDRSNFETSCDTSDTLCRNIIIESMKILYSEDAVLQ